MLNDFIKVSGKLDIVKTDINNNVLEKIHVPNLVVTTGKNYIASRMVGNSQLVSHMSLGTSSTATSLAQTALVSELSRVVLTSQTSAGNVATFAATFGPGVATGALTEAGIFTASSGGTMLCRTVFNVINKNAGDTITVSWTVTIS